MTIHILPTKTRGCGPQSPETDESDENGGCPSDKTRVCQEQGFRHPDFMFGGIIFGNCYRKLYSIIFLGALITVM